MRALTLAALVVVLSAALPSAQRIGYPAEEFGARRERLARAIGSGTVLLFGATAPSPGVRFRQDNDFYYLTGNESLNAALVMDAASGAATLFLPRQSASEITYEGANWLAESDAASRHGFQAVLPSSALPEFLSRRRSLPGSDQVWMRLSERDAVNHGRIDTAITTARRLATPFAQYPSEDASRATGIRTLFPYYQLQDLAPHLDRLRLIKTPREIEILRANGRVSAEAMARAIGVSRPGAYEYELEAEATRWMVTHGMQSPAYPAIVASGPNGNQWHYEANGRQMQEGDLVVMDYGGSLDYLTIDITRTWPVSGQFSERQRAAYLCVLEAQQATIAAIRPGVTRDTVRSLAEAIYRRHGFDPAYAYVGHYVGLSVHDVGDWSAPFQEGMVLAIEPIIDLPDERIHVRIEDTVLVTPTGSEVLTGNVPKAIEPLLALLRR